MTDDELKARGYGKHFDGKRFYNVPYKAHAGFLALTEWLLMRDRGQWSPRRHAISTGSKPPERVANGETRATFIGHATVLLQIDGNNFITDPIYAERASPVAWAGPRRMRPPGIAFDDLPTIDAVLLSHNHYDHLCMPTLRRLAKRDRPMIFTGLGNAEVLGELGHERVHEMDWWQSARLDGLGVSFVPAQHFSGRSAFDRDKTLWGGFVIEGARGRIFFAGDTGAGPHFEEIRRRFGAPDLALLPIGAYRPRAIMQRIHLSPKDAVVAHQELRARASLAIHFGTFQLADDGEREPVEDLDRALEEEGLSREVFWVLEEGEGRSVQWRDPVSDASTTGDTTRGARP